MSILTLGSKKRKEGKFPIKEWEKAKKGEEIPNQRMGESKKKKVKKKEEEEGKSTVTREENKNAFKN